MNQRNTVLLFLFAAFLAFFLQYARLDGFLYLDAVKNTSLWGTMAKKAPWAEADSVSRDRYVIIYDPMDVMSMYARHNAETMLLEQKKSYESHPFYEASLKIPADTRGVLLATGRLGAMAGMREVIDYVAHGGTAVLLQHPEPSEAISADVLAAFGLTSIGGERARPCQRRRGRGRERHRRAARLASRVWRWKHLCLQRHGAR